MASVLGIRQRLAAGGGQIRAVRRADRLATFGITAGGILIVACVCFIFVFILAEALALFRPARVEGRGTLALAATGPAPAAVGEPQDPFLLGADEYQRSVFGLRRDGRLVFHDLADGRLLDMRQLEGLEGAVVASASRRDDLLAAGTADGRGVLARLRFRPVYEAQTLVDLERRLDSRGSVLLDTGGRPIEQIGFLEDGAVQLVVGLVGSHEIVVVRRDRDEETEERFVIDVAPRQLTCIALGRVDALAAGTRDGHLLHWELLDEPRLTDVVAIGDGALTSLTWAVGGISVLVGEASGRRSAWFRARPDGEEGAQRLVRAHDYASHAAAVSVLGPAPRDKSFVSAGADGVVRLTHLTSERELLRLEPPGLARGAFLTPKGDGLVVALAGGRLARYALDSPHPEISWTTLFGKVWYEGYPGPEYVWQSTGASVDFEPKLSLVPLVFGTIKATLYAMLFAVPLSILGALYTSQFVHPDLRGRIKPVVEIMAALPSVVIGFLAGLWLASRVELHLVPVLLMIVVVPAFGTAGVLLWPHLPRRLLRGLKPGTELAVILPMLVAGAWLALLAGPGIEATLFAGDLKHWLYRSFDMVYDQRNSLVVGLAMGFAVIPIIFTIAEDAFSSVPSHLTAASLALGASRWQTAVRVVLPTASPGIFSAVMVGFGRAVGETMIVLMATGNTPVLDWSIFNGMRTLAANIAVEVPEAPQGGTLYRVLFLSAGVLFLMTFLVNTVAELVRQRLRERYRSL